MVKDSVVNFKDPKLTKELSLIENNRVNSLASLDLSLIHISEPTRPERIWDSLLGV